LGFRLDSFLSISQICFKNIFEGKNKLRDVIFIGEDNKLSC